LRWMVCSKNLPAPNITPDNACPKYPAAGYFQLQQTLVRQGYLCDNP